MDKRELVALLEEMARGLDFLEDNPHRVRAYRHAARGVAGFTGSLPELVETGRAHEIPGVGKIIAGLLVSWQAGDLRALDELRARVPAGLEELLRVPRLGMKKIRQLSHERGVTGLDDFLVLAESGELAQLSGFTASGAKRMAEATRRLMEYRGYYRLDEAWAAVDAAREQLGEVSSLVTGDLRRGAETVTRAELVINADEETLVGFPGVVRDEQGALWINVPGRVPVIVHAAPGDLYATKLFATTGSDEHVQTLRAFAASRRVLIGADGVEANGRQVPVREEEELYALAGVQYVAPELREDDPRVLELAAAGELPELLREDELQGVLHVHTTYSDGRGSLEDMVSAAAQRGYDWIGIADHSRSAYYAGGLKEKDLEKQCVEIDHLNESGECVVFKGSEVDILPDGSLDYSPSVLARLDYVVVSVHSAMDMDRASMTARIVRALENPATTVLAHPTGRVLLSREAYAVDLDAVLDAALAHNVVLEINANPHRLDLQWNYIEGFTSRGGLVAINPDAHEVAGLDDVRYGVQLGRKGWLRPEQCINTYDVQRIREVF